MPWCVVKVAGAAVATDLNLGLQCCMVDDVDALTTCDRSSVSS